jgi:hypothetical protein
VKLKRKPIECLEGSTTHSGLMRREMENAEVKPKDGNINLHIFFYDGLFKKKERKR